MHQADLEPVVEAGVSVLGSTSAAEFVLPKTEPVIVEDCRQRCAFLDGQTVLVSRQGARPGRVEPAEVEERQRSIADVVAPIASTQRTRVQVPVGHVIRLVAKDRRAREQARHEIDPFLVHEQALSNIHAAAVDQALLPPGEEAARLGRVGEADEAEVVRARAQDGLFVGDEPVAWDWFEQVRDERDARAAEPSGQLGSAIGR